MPYFTPWVPDNIRASGHTLILLDKCRRGSHPETSPSGWGDTLDANWPNGFVTNWVIQQKRTDPALRKLYTVFKTDETEDSFWNRFGFSFLVPGVVRKRNGAFAIPPDQFNQGLEEFDDIVIAAGARKLLIVGNDFIEGLIPRSEGGREMAKTKFGTVWRLFLQVGNQNISAVGIYNPYAWAQQHFDDESKAFARDLLNAL